MYDWLSLLWRVILLSLCSIITSIYLLNSNQIPIIWVFVFLFSLLHHDFRLFLSLGPGGTPSTICGYIKITVLRLFALSDPYSPPTILNKTTPSSILYLPQRSGPRPTIAGIAPQRQLDQFGCPLAHMRLRHALANIAHSNPYFLRIDVSCFERKGLALFAIHHSNLTCNGEICHVHHTDGSLHLSLHPLDTKVVLDRGWGQRHPLAKGGWLTRYVPREFVMIYAPRSQEELEIVGHIIEAALWCVSGRRSELTIPRCKAPSA
jgi:hypothetical protein